VVANQAELKMRAWYFGATGRDKTNNPQALGQTFKSSLLRKNYVGYR
jgi:hypothetical protein